jgi:putative endonuclease
MSTPRARRGAAAEAFVTGRLERAGYEIIDRNWRARSGELDIIALHGELLVFVEVRSRRGEALGTADESVDARKLQRLMSTALSWLDAHPDHSERVWRVDLIAVTLDDRGTLSAYNHYENLTLD